MFDRYVMVDWSSHNHPKIGKDSIWICDLRTDAEPGVTNPPTRLAAEQHLRSLLAEAVSRNQRVLIGLDFPYGYPRGLASKLGLIGPGWRAVWDFIASRVTDSATNQSNRFQVAAEINRRVGYDVFWGRPASQQLNGLSAHSLDARGGHQALSLAEWRDVEVVLREQKRHPHSTWKLFGAGSVGSQSLTGIPVLWRLRSDPQLEAVSRVWPFELRNPDVAQGHPAIVHAEIWPGIESIPSSNDGVKDRAQVIAVAQRFRRLDQTGELQTLFRAPSEVASEEGWILGVHPMAVQTQHAIALDK